MTIAPNDHFERDDCIVENIVGTAEGCVDGGREFRKVGDSEGKIELEELEKLEGGDETLKGCVDVCWSVGVEVGSTVGVDDGEKEGIKEGIIVGDTDGLVEGDMEGLVIGDVVGEKLGIMEGAFVGILEGEYEGFPLGD